MEPPKAAITADSRQYSVFTFLEGEVNDAATDDCCATLNDTDSQNAIGNVTDVTAMARTDAEPPAVHMSHWQTSCSVSKEEDIVNLEFEVDTYHSELTPPTAKRKIVPNMTLDFDAALSPASSLPDVYEFDGQHTPHDTDDHALSDCHNRHSNDVISNSAFGPDFDWEDNADTVAVEPIPEYKEEEQIEENNKRRVVQINGRTYCIDMEAIDHYKKVLSHGGYYGDGVNAIIVFAACYLPNKSIANYHYIMDNLFLYVMSQLELLVAHEYMIVYFHCASLRQRLPGIRWFRRCYGIIDHRIRKSLCGFLVVHPSLILKAILLMMKPFVSSKFSAKVQYVSNLTDLARHVSTEYMLIPDEVIQNDHLFDPLGVSIHKFFNH